MVCQNCGGTGHFEAIQHRWVHTGSRKHTCSGAEKAETVDDIFRPVSKEEYDNRPVSKKDVDELARKLGSRR